MDHYLTKLLKLVSIVIIVSHWQHMSSINHAIFCTTRELANAVYILLHFDLSVLKKNNPPVKQKESPRIAHGNNEVIHTHSPQTTLVFRLLLCIAEELEGRVTIPVLIC